MKALTLTNQKICPLNVKVFADKETDKRMDGQTDKPKNYMPPIYRCRGKKKVTEENLSSIILTLWKVPV